MNKSDITQDYCMLKGPSGPAGLRLVVALLYRPSREGRGGEDFLHRVLSLQPGPGPAGAGDRVE